MILDRSNPEHVAALAFMDAVQAGTAIFDANNPEHVRAAAFMEAVEDEQNQRALEAIERGRKDDDPGMLFENFLVLHNLPRRESPGLA